MNNEEYNISVNLKQIRCDAMENGIQARLNGDCECPYTNQDLKKIWEDGWNKTHSLICSVM